jgi:predicted DNA-binding transcriptional regulator YafY
MHRAAGRLSASGLDVAEALERLLGQDGRLDPSQDFLAAAAGASTRTVGRQLARLRDLGLLWWQRRLERSAGVWRCEQTSNAYVLTPAEPAAPCDGHSVRPVGVRLIKKAALEVLRAAPEVDEAAQRALAAVREQRKLALGLA